jgi:AcrR family transcriptional regulator
MARQRSEVVAPLEGERRALSGERVDRIIAAMRDAVGEYGIAGATFERVAEQAGVSRGLLHYHFGTKEKLLIEVMRRDVELRVTALDRALAPASTVDQVLTVLRGRLEDLVELQPGLFVLIVELFAASRNNEEIRRELAEHYERTRRHLADLLREKERQGVLTMRFQPDAVVSFLMAGADGLAIQILTDPDRSHDRSLATAVEAARFLLTDD